MNNIPLKVTNRLITAVPKFQKILNKAKEKDINEADTVIIVMDMLEEIFGFDKYSEVTREYAIKNTFCDLAVKKGKRIEFLIEVKSIGWNLKENHLRQVVNYASGEGVKWAVLTNGIKWEIHRITVDKKVHSEKLFEFDLTKMNPQKKDQQDLLFLLCKRGVQKDLIDNYYEYRQSVNRYTIGALLLTKSVTTALRKELRKLKSNIKVDIEEIKLITQNEVIKREILESEAGIEASKQVNKFIKKHEKEKKKA